MKIAILGFDVEGRASFDYFQKQGHELEIRDQNPQAKVPEGIPSIIGEQYLDNLGQFDLLIRTPGLPAQKILEKNPGVAGKITTQTNEFFKVSPTKNIIGVTGTKGKGTTCTLITKMLEADGKQVFLGGNIGTAPLTFLNQLTPESWVVLELSSFQLSDIKYSPHIGVCLMVVPEHLDWHPNVNDYTYAKAQMFAHQTAEDFAVYLAGNELSQKIVSGSQAQKIPYFEPPGAYVKDGIITIGDQPICPVNDLKLLGEHNWQNVCAAVTAVWQTSQNTAAIKSVLTNFAGLEHRLEFVREVSGVKYYNDSFGTAPETATVAIKAFDQPKVLILGGSDKGADYTEMAKTIASGNVHKVLLIGEQATRIQDALKAAGFSNFMPGGENMPAIVRNAQLQAQPGDVVLLSPACASFDMFKNYKERGEQFKQAVQALG